LRYDNIKNVKGRLRTFGQEMINEIQEQKRIMFWGVGLRKKEWVKVTSYLGLKETTPYGHAWYVNYIYI